MVKKIIWTKKANTNFNNVLEFLEEEWGEKVAINFVKRAYAIIQLLSEHPELGSMEKPDEGIRGFLITKHKPLMK